MTSNLDSSTVHTDTADSVSSCQNSVKDKNKVLDSPNELAVVQPCTEQSAVDSFHRSVSHDEVTSEQISNLDVFSSRGHEMFCESSSSSLKGFGLSDQMSSSQASQLVTVPKYSLSERVRQLQKFELVMLTAEMIQEFESLLGKKIYQF